MTALKTLLVLSMALLPAAAWAACSTDADCAAGEVCVAVPCACAAPACDPDAPDCVTEPCTCDAASECVPAESFDDDTYYSGDCEADADCPMGFTCQEVQAPCASTGCACPPCEEGTECTCDCPTDPEPCEATTYKYCAYTPVECASDADCSEGFECKAQEVCSGSAGCGCAVPACDPEGECPEPEPCECDETEYTESCEVVGHYCEAKQIECEAAADCPEGWECVGVRSDCACPAIACDSSDPEGCADLPPCDCGSEPTVSYCMPGGWAESAVADYASGGSDTSAPTAAESPTDTFMKNAQEAAAAADGSTAGTDDAAKAGSGCSYATTAAGLGSLVLTLLALLGLAVRRATVLGR
jgi:hypothetical protein